MANISILPITTNLISTDTGSPVRFSITNLSSSHLTLYWLDRTGQEVAYGQIDQNTTYVQPTLSTHAWEVRSNDGKVAFEFKPTYAGNITIDTSYHATFTDFSERVSQTPNGLWSTAQGYGLINVAKSLGVVDNVTLPLNGQNNNLALDAISAPSAWAAGYTGKGVKVAVIDVGIAASVEINNRIVDGYDFNDNDTTPQPNSGAYMDHALGVASIIAGSHSVHNGQDTKGVAPDASLINVRVGNSITGSTSNNIASGIRFAVDHGAKVICMPLESSGNQIDPLLVDAVHYAYQHNVVTVIIGGNYSNFGPTGPALIAQQLKGEVIDVGNYNVTAGTPFDSSNMPGSTPLPWVVASSSGYVPNSSGGYTYWNDGGTSFAGPYVAGLAALLFQQSPNATATDVINKIIFGASIGQNSALAAISPSPVVGTSQNDTLKAMSGATIDGGAGMDTVQFTGSANSYFVSGNSNSFTVINKLDHSANVLTGVERLVFADKSVALDSHGVGGQVYRLYQAAFNRTPDEGGLGYWIGIMDSGATLNSIANGFAHSSEFISLYGVKPSNEKLVTAMYQNVLHRAPDSGGLKFWVDALNHGGTVPQLLTAFSESPENQTEVLKVIGQGFDYTPFHG